jgi:hypothetical protein
VQASWTRLPLSFIRLSQSSPSSAGPGWAHELKHDGYRLEWHSHLINMAAMAIAQIDSKKKSTIPKDPIKDCARLKKFAWSSVQKLSFLAFGNVDNSRVCFF